MTSMHVFRQFSCQGDSPLSGNCSSNGMSNAERVGTCTRLKLESFLVLAWTKLETFINHILQYTKDQITAPPCSKQKKKSLFEKWASYPHFLWEFTWNSHHFLPVIGHRYPRACLFVCFSSVSSSQNKCDYHRFAKTSSHTPRQKVMLMLKWKGPLQIIH